MAKSGAKEAAPTKGRRSPGGKTYQKYQPHYADAARIMCRGGAIDTDLAAAFGVDVRTIVRWKGAQPDFAAALDAGKPVADEMVRRALFERACGYSHPAVKHFVVDGRVETVNYVEHYAPDTGACAFWLKNRQPKEWRDKHELDVPGLGDLAEALQLARKRVGG